MALITAAFLGLVGLSLIAESYRKVDPERVCRQRKLNLYFKNYILKISSQALTKFRLTKCEFFALTKFLVANGLLKQENIISAERQVLTALLFYASGSYQHTIALAMKMTQKAVSKCINIVTNALNDPLVRDRFIRFPTTPQERENIKKGFYEKYNFPGVVGCVDGSHIAILRPHQGEETYFNRKHFHSLNVQFICDSNLRILSVNTKFGGASHDSHVWRMSKASAFMQKLHKRNARNSRQPVEGGWLLGDSGYPQRPWLMTPYLNAAPGSPEERFTRRHVKARTCVERCLGVLKMRWRCISRNRTLSYHPDKCAKIIIACSVLHNIANEKNIPMPSDQEYSVHHFHRSTNYIHREEVSNELAMGRAARDYLIRTCFNN